ncbi:MAG: PaaX family transcriptional regulator [Streptosporangiales bacterium]|nr:PaaX family transcriptional regulator [Streptosporangiales bacterium]
MNARSALFDLYGDHLRSRGGRATIAALVRLLAPLEFSPPAVRTAVSRMVRQGWLEPIRLPSGAGYGLTPRATLRLDEAADRIYRHTSRTWDGGWHLLVFPRPRDRARRERLRQALTFLGYAPLEEATWLGPRPSPEVDALLDAEDVRAERFVATYDGDAARLVARAWDLEAIGRAYGRWLADSRELIAGLGDDPGDEAVFAARSRLVHEWRKFLFRDPGLPPRLLPEGWPGTAAAAYFDAEAARLLPAAARFVDRCVEHQS